MVNVGSPSTPGANRTQHIPDHAIVKAFIDGHGNDPDHVLATLLDHAIGVRNVGDILTWLASGQHGFAPPPSPAVEVDVAINTAGPVDAKSTVPAAGGLGPQVAVTKAGGAAALGIVVPAAVPFGPAPAWPVYLDAQMQFGRDTGAAPMQVSVIINETTPAGTLAAAAVTAMSPVVTRQVPTALSYPGSPWVWNESVPPFRLDPAFLKAQRSWSLAYIASGPSTSAGAWLRTTNAPDQGSLRSGTQLRAMRFLTALGG